jgi:hypothetical protein
MTRYLLSDIEDDPDNWVARLGFTDYSQYDVNEFFVNI